MLNSREHLAHNIGGVTLSESLCSHDSVEELTTFAVFHYDMHVAVIDIALVELDDVWMINSLKDCQFFLEKADVLGNVFSQD